MPAIRGGPNRGSRGSQCLGGLHTCPHTASELTDQLDGRPNRQLAAGEHHLIGASEHERSAQVVDAIVPEPERSTCRPANPENDQWRNAQLLDQITAEQILGTTSGDSNRTRSLGSEVLDSVSDDRQLPRLCGEIGTQGRHGRLVTQQPANLRDGQTSRQMIDLIGPQPQVLDLPGCDRTRTQLGVGKQRQPLAAAPCGGTQRRSPAQRRVQRQRRNVCHGHGDPDWSATNR
jgi:hypothetical protein